jgi:hypothetical protein
MRYSFMVFNFRAKPEAMEKDRQIYRERNQKILEEKRWTCPDPSCNDKPFGSNRMLQIHIAFKHQVDVSK